MLCKDGSTSWETLAVMKESFSVQVAKFTVDKNFHEKIAFKWWVPQVIKQHTRIIKAIKTRYLKRTHKYGIRLPKSVTEAYEIDKENGYDLWHQAIIKEMKNNAYKLRVDRFIPNDFYYFRFEFVLKNTNDLDSKNIKIERESTYLKKLYYFITTPVVKFSYFQV